MNVPVCEYHIIFCALCRSGYFYSLSPFDSLDKSEFPEAIRQSTVRMPPRVIFSRQKHIYILDPPSHHKKGSLPHNFQSFSNFSGYLEVLGI